MASCEETQQNSGASEDNLSVEPLPKKRKYRALIAMIVISLLFSVGIVVDGFLSRGTDTFIFIGLGLVGMLLGTLVDRFCLVFEEWHNWQGRYDNKVQIFKACFSGISWRAVGCVLFVVVVSLVIGLAATDAFESYYIVYVFGAIGVGPLVMRLLNINAP